MVLEILRGIVWLRSFFQFLMFLGRFVTLRILELWLLPLPSSFRWTLELESYPATVG